MALFSKGLRYKNQRDFSIIKKKKLRKTFLHTSRAGYLSEFEDGVEEKKKSISRVSECLTILLGRQTMQRGLAAVLTLLPCLLYAASTFYQV